MQTQISLLCPYLSLSPFPSTHKPNNIIYYSKPNNSKNKPLFLCSFSSVSSSSTHSLSTSTPTSNPSLTNFLIETLAFSEPQALSISNSFASRKSLENPQSVVQFLKQIGFSNEHIRSTIQIRPKILFSNVDKNLKPKLHFFQDLGLTGPHLGNFISTHSHILNHSLERTMIPCVDIIKKTLVNDEKNQDLIRILQRHYVIASKAELRLKCNIAFLESCGIVGPQLSMLLKWQPWLFFVTETALRNLVSRVLDMGFSLHSKMLVHAVYVVSGLSSETFDRKIELLRSFGFPEDECMEMFRKAPHLLGASETKLKLGMEFFLIDCKWKRTVLLRQPACLMYSMGQRILPRYRVLQVLKCKTLLKEPSLLTALGLSDEEFLEKFISTYRDDAEELMVAYKGDPLD